MPDESTLEETLAAVSSNCLHGRPVPAVLRALWEAQLDDEVIVRLGEDVDASLHTEIDWWEEWTDTPRKDFNRAFKRMRKEIAFIGNGSEPHLFGYWLYERKVSLDEAPIVVLTSEAEFVCRAPTLQDYVMWGAYSYRQQANVPGLRRWFTKRKIKTLDSLEAIEQAISSLPDPNERFLEYFER